jgi:hypothetical protein
VRRKRSNAAPEHALEIDAPQPVGGRSVRSGLPPARAARWGKRPVANQPGMDKALDQPADVAAPMHAAAGMPRQIANRLGGCLHHCAHTTGQN